MASKFFIRGLISILLLQTAWLLTGGFFHSSSLEAQTAGSGSTEIQGNLNNPHLKKFFDPEKKELFLVIPNQQVILCYKVDKKKGLFLQASRQYSQDLLLQSDQNFLRFPGKGATFSQIKSKIKSQ